MIILSRRSRFLCGLHGLHGTKSVISAFLVNDQSRWVFLGYSAKLLFSHACNFLWTILKWSFLYMIPNQFSCPFISEQCKSEKPKKIGLIWLKNSLKVKIEYLPHFLWSACHQSLLSFFRFPSHSHSSFPLQETYIWIQKYEMAWQSHAIKNLSNLRLVIRNLLLRVSQGKEQID